MAKSKNIYCLPLRKKDFTKAVSDPKEHFAHFKYAIDFDLPEGSDVLAAANGEVIDVRIDSKKGGNNPKYAKYANYIILKHNNGEYSQYVHLRHNGSLKKIGEKVKKGEVIGFSGNTGFSTSPHLHFTIFVRNNTKIGWRTIEPRFEKEVNIKR